MTQINVVKNHPSQPSKASNFTSYKESPSDISTEELNTADLN